MKLKVVTNTNADKTEPNQNSGHSISKTHKITEIHKNLIRRRYAFTSESSKLQDWSKFKSETIGYYDNSRLHQTWLGLYRTELQVWHVSSNPFDIHGGRLHGRP